MSDDDPRSAKPTVNYPTDVSRCMQLMLQRKISDPDGVVAAFTEVREDERARMVDWLRKRPCPTPATWAALVASLEKGEYRDG